MNFKSLLPSNWFPAKTEKKNYVPVQTQSFHSWLQNIGRSDVAKTAAVIYYIKCYPVSSGIGEISDRLKNITPIFADANGEEIKNEVTKFLSKPNDTDTYFDLLNKMNINFKTTGEIYIVKRGITRLMELEILPSAKVTAQFEKNGRPHSFVYSSADDSITFTQNNDGRYFDKTNTQELIYHFSYNPESYTSGLSPLSAVALEIEQYLSAGTHNLSLLTNSIKPSVVLSSKSDMMPNSDQVQQFKELLDEFYAGTGNAGNYLITGNFDVKPVSERSDMDYKDLNNTTRNAIFQKLGVPITIADTTASTFNNRQLDQLAFYDDTVIPLFTMYSMLLVKSVQGDMRSSQEITQVLFNETQIPALAERALRNLERRSQIGHLSVNELRELDSRAEVSGGDIIYKPANYVPVATDEPLDEEMMKQIEYELEQRGKRG